MNNRFWHHPLGHLLLVLALGSLVYANTLGAPFVLDDLESIVRNETLRDLGNFLPGGPGLEFHLRRAVAYFTFAVNYRLGGLDVTGYHLVNLAIHLGTALLVYSLVRLTVRTPVLAGSRLAPHAGTAALLAALFFALHPVQTQAVTYVVQRLTSLGTFFYLLALVLYGWGRVQMAGGARDAAVSRFRPGPRLCLAGAMLAAVLAMFTKEIAFTLPLAALLYEQSFFAGPWRPRLRALLPLLLTLPLVPLLVLDGGELSAAGTLLQSRADIPRGHYLLTQFPVIVTYLRLLLLPVGQTLDYDYPLFTSFFVPRVALSFLLLLGMLGLAGWLHRSSGRPQESTGAGEPAWRLVAFGIFWFFLTLSVESGLVPLPDLIFEHRLYLPSVGLAMALAVAVAIVLGGRLPLLAAFLALALLGTATWQRNRVWQSELSLWEDTARKAPGNPRALYNYGYYLGESGRYDEAAGLLARAVALAPRHAEAWHNLGRTYLLLGRDRDAVAALRTAVNLAPQLEHAALNLASALLRTGQPGAALPLLVAERSRAPGRADIRFNLALAYAGVGDHAAARGELAEIQRLDPTLARTLAPLLQRPSR